MTVPRRLLILACVAACGAAGAGTAYVLPNGAPGIGFDDLRYSRSLHRVIVPGGRAGVIALIEPETGRMTPITGFSASASFSGGHGFGVTSVDEGRGLLFAIDRSTKTVDAIDPNARKMIASCGLAAMPDYVRYVDATRELWITEPGAEQIEIISVSSDMPPTLMRTATIPVHDGPESLVIDPARGRAYTHRWRGSTLAIDVHSRTIVGDWKNGCNGSRGIDLEPERGLVFVACGEGSMSTLDALHGGRIISTISEGSGYDVMGYNPRLRHAYLAGGACSCMTTVAVSKAGKLSVLGHVAAPSDTHCVVADDVGNAWVCEPSRGSIRRVVDTYSQTP